MVKVIRYEFESRRPGEGGTRKLTPSAVFSLQDGIMLQCWYCGKRFKNKQALRAHLCFVGKETESSGLGSMFGSLISKLEKSFLAVDVGEMLIVGVDGCWYAYRHGC